MADIKINDLPALVTQASTDVYEVSNNAATLSSKETRAQMLAYNRANFATAPYVIGDLFYAINTTTPARLADAATGNVLLSGGVGAVPNYGKVTYGHMQTAGASKLLGNPTGSTAAVSEITLGAGLSFVGSALTATGDASVDLQDAYDNGDGTITCDILGMKPVVIVTGDATYKGAFELQGNTAVIQLFNCPSNASNEKIAVFIQDDGFFQGLLLSDDRISNTEWLTVSRTGITVDSVNFPNGTLQYAGNEVATTSYTYSGRYTPALTAVFGVGSLTLVGALYTVIGDIVTVTAKFTCVPSDTSMVIGVGYPVTMGFNDVNQSFLSGGSAIHNPGVDDGSMVAAGSQSGQDRANVEIQDIVFGQTYTVSVSFMGIIQ